MCKKTQKPRSWMPLGISYSSLYFLYHFNKIKLASPQDIWLWITMSENSATCKPRAQPPNCTIFHWQCHPRLPFFFSRRSSININFEEIWKWMWNEWSMVILIYDACQFKELQEEVESSINQWRKHRASCFLNSQHIKGFSKSDGSRMLLFFCFTGGGGGNESVPLILLTLNF